MKTAYREQVERLERGCVETIGKEHFTYLYNPAKTKAFTPHNIRAEWSKAGLYPFNPEKVLNEIPKPLDQLTAPEFNVTEVGSCTHDEVPQTPATPVSAEALTRIWTAIGQLPDDDVNRQHKQKLQRKLLEGGRLCFAKCTLLEEQNRFLAEINNESKVRRSTGSEVVGKAKVMLWQDIDNTRKELAAKKKAKAAKKAEREEKKVEREKMNAQKEVQREAKKAEQALENPSTTSNADVRSEEEEAETESKSTPDPVATLSL